MTEYTVGNWIGVCILSFGLILNCHYVFWWFAKLCAGQKKSELGDTQKTALWSIEILIVLYILFFWSFVFGPKENGQFMILHKRKASTKNIIVSMARPNNLFGALGTYRVLNSENNCVIISIDKKGVSIFKKL